MRTKRRASKVVSPDIRALLFSWFVGFSSGFLASVPLGPINITIINDGARRGFLGAWMIGLGAVVMDMIYCSVGFAGFTPIFGSRVVRAAMELGSFLLVFILGLKYLLAKPVLAKNPCPSKIEKQWRPHSSFMIGFARVLGNPGVLLFWITIAATLTSQHWVHRTLESKAVCIAGIGVGASLWFSILSYAVTKLHHHVSPKTLTRLSQLSGATLLGISLVVGYRIVALLSIR